MSEYNGGFSVYLIFFSFQRKWSGIGGVNRLRWGLQTNVSNLNKFQSFKVLCLYLFYQIIFDTDNYRADAEINIHVGKNYMYK